MTDTPPVKQVEQFTQARDEHLRAAAIQFGKDLRHWRRSNGWAQDTAMDWGQAVGKPHVYSSQWSQLETGAMRNPSPGLFWNFGLQNAALACQDYGPITSRVLLDRVKAAQPVRHADGEPWDAADFFAAYIGLEKWPHGPGRPEPEITTEAAAEWSQELRHWFRHAADQAGLEPLNAAVMAMEHADPDSPWRADYQRLLLGFGDLDPETLLEQWRQESPGPAEWLAAWRRKLGLKGSAPVAPWSREQRG